MQADEFYLKSEEEMLRRMSGYEEAVRNTAEAAQKCSLTIEFGKRHLPGFTAPDGMTNEQYLRRLCTDGLRRRYGEPTKEHLERLEYELNVIISMGFVDYYLIVWDFILCKNARHTRGTRTRQRRGKHCSICNGHHGHRPDSLQPDF